MAHAGVLHHRFTHDDEEALPQHRDAIGRAGQRFEFALRDFDERHRVLERAEEPTIDNADVVIAAKRGEVPPLFEAHVFRQMLPAPFHVEQRAERGEREPLCVRRARDKTAVGGVGKIRHQLDEHEPVEWIEARPKWLQVVGELDDLVPARIVTVAIIGRP